MINHKKNVYETSPLPKTFEVESMLSQSCDVVAFDGYGYVFPKFLATVARSFPSILLSWFKSAWKFQCEWLGYEPKAYETADGI